MEDRSRRGFVLWFTGLSGSGKSTLAERVAPVLRSAGRTVEVLDGDEVRLHLSKGLGFSKEGRDANIRRIGWTAHVLARNGIVAITAAISPYRAIRGENRALCPDDFLEVFVDCPLEACMDRDVKGLYKKAIAGEIPQFTGVSDPYEAPEAAEVTVRTAAESHEESTRKILDAIRARGYFPAA
jgi:adenylyl-sulfate kinase